MKAIKNYILQQVANQEISQQQAKEYLLELSQLTSGRAENIPGTTGNEIAVIGMAGRFPKAENAEKFWQLLSDGINCIDEFPIERQKDGEHILRNPYYMEYLIGEAIKPEDMAEVYAKAGYLDETDKFDTAFFGIPPSEATYMDPNQRLTLEVAWEAMEDAGYGGETLFGSNTGVYIGKEGTNFSLYRYNTKKDPMQLTGSWESIIGSRISYLFNFRGPCMLVDTACSASLVSVHMAAKAILSGECDTALAGGVNIIPGEFKPRYQGGMSMDSVESEDSVIRTFDASANGTVWGEGVAMVMLKSLKQAVKDGDHIHAVIKGSAINNDGASNGLTAPNAEAQEDVIVKAWDNAGVHPETLSYIEAHGTGTVLGDPIEFKGLTRAFRRFTERSQFCAIGSLKTNMGHLVASSGIASLFKVVKSMKYKTLAPTINFNAPNPYINFPNSPLYVSDKNQPWPESETPRRAAISSFGFSHTNCHMVVEEAPGKPRSDNQAAQYCFTLSAKKKTLLLDYVARYQDFCQTQSWNLADLCFTAATGRGHYAHRLAIVASDEQDFVGKLNASINLIEEGPAAKEGIAYGSHHIVSEKKKQREQGEITDKEKKAATDSAKSCLTAYLSESHVDALTALTEHYCKGADVDWKACYAAETRYRLALPTYPFERVRVWAEPKVSQVKGFDSQLHPLVERCTGRQSQEWVYESDFNNETHWVLDDHKIKGTCVVPGTTYLEMARAAVKDAKGWASIDLRNICFLQPMVVAEGETRRMQLSLSQKGETVNFTISSLDVESDDWVLHVEGGAECITDLPNRTLPIEEIKQAATEIVEDYRIESDTGVFQFGPHWDAIRSTWTTPDVALAKLSLKPELQHELESLAIHPSVLDNAMNLTSQSTGKTYLPFMYKSFKLYAPFTAEMYTHVVPKTTVTGEEETHTYDVTLTDGEGNVIAESVGYITKKVHSFGFSQQGKEAFTALTWSRIPGFDATDTRPEGELLLVADDASQITELESAFKAQQINVRVLDISRGMSIEALREALSGSVTATTAGIVLANDLQVQVDDILNGGIEKARKRSSDLWFKLCKAITEEKVKLPWGIALLSAEGWQVSGLESHLNPIAAASAMFVQSFAMEVPGLECRVLDGGVTTSKEELVTCLVQIPTGKNIALREGELYQQVLAPHTVTEPSGPMFKENGVYVVTGGLGGLGLLAAQHIVSQAKAHIVLMGRSQLPERNEWSAIAAQQDHKYAEVCQAMLSMQESAASVSYVSADVANKGQLADAIGSIKSNIGQINGVLHTAGIAGDGFVMRKSFETYDSVLKPKFEGSCNLLSLLEGDALDFVVLYSSITACIGGEGQTDYAAANAFLDALTPCARALGIPVYSINWPLWQEAGMAIAFQIEEGSTPFNSLKNEEAFTKLTQVVLAGASSVIASDINPTIFKQIEQQVPFTLSPEMEDKLAKTASSASDNAEASGGAVEITGKSEIELTKTETTLAQIYACVLGVSEIDVFTNFQDMGGNSIIATHLLKVVEAEFPGMVDISDVFSYPSVDVMAEYIDEKRGVIPEDEGEQDAKTDWESLMDSVTDGNESIDNILDKI
ncbi:SDR family NAD(P)-dependent oxidoreductase [Vibrio sp. Of7-15]|uniref:type I polyketide synthase n=1 Tax=Vibrio sp. Of7-15 TaxID=2724879 RepID=UPI001EF3870B|nr:type I polyketide synthase [Vibrio sp. Of7-15]MCG7495638.1 SDR family NAD(P)-dependent oxidoreductase [Vibrio sp. Of7-15]